MQFLFSPMFIGVFLSVLVTLEGRPEHVIPKLQQVELHEYILFTASTIFPVCVETLKAVGWEESFCKLYIVFIFHFVGVVFCCFGKLATMDTFSVSKFPICSTAISGLNGIIYFILCLLWPFECFTFLGIVCYDTWEWTKVESQTKLSCFPWDKLNRNWFFRAAVMHQ